MANLTRLSELQQKRRRIILGLMSGTSIDGLDLALCSFSGCGSDVKFEILHHGTKSYSDEQQYVLRMLATQEMVRMEDVCIYHTELSRWHADMVRQALGEWGVDVSEVDLIASHGQTVRHAPKRIHGLEVLPNSTFQLGEPDHLAYLTGILTLSDFRQKHVAAGGEGAPLAGYGDQLLFRDASECRVLLNVGGISNITVLDPAAEVSALPVTFDTGPGNTLMDHVVRMHFAPMKYDEGGKLAAEGIIYGNLLSELMNHEFFNQNPPKTTGPEAFSPEFLFQSMMLAGAEEISPRDLLATLNRFTAETIAEGILSGLKLTHGYNTSPNQAPVRVLISGGGAHNKTLVDNISECLQGIPISDFSSIGVHPDAKEALFFAAIANEFICGNTFFVQRIDGTSVSVSFGKLSFPL